MSKSKEAVKMSDKEATEIIDLPELGQLQGSITETIYTHRKIYQFLGVKYAESPSGLRRFKAPVPVEPWSGVKYVTNYGRRCPNIKAIAELSKSQITEDDLEDCLNLCIYSTSLTARKPTMVYVHGGGFYSGGANQYPPGFLLEKDIVLVVPQYRLGPLGFLSTKNETIPGNAGVLDVILALKWVQKYISYFGGDENNITLAGQSAGAAIVSAINLSPNVPDGLFHKLILQSGSPISTWCWDDQPMENAKRIAKLAGIDTKTMTIEELNEHFMKMDLLTLLKSFSKHMLTGTINGINSIGGHRLTIGGPSNLLPVTPYDLFKSGEVNGKTLPLLAGVCKGEAGFGICTIYDCLQASYGFKNEQFNKYHLLDFCTRIMGTEDKTGAVIGLASSIYFTQDQLNRGDFGEMSNGILDFVNTTIIKGPTLRIAQENAKCKPNETFLYTFDYHGEHTRFGDGVDVSKYPFQVKVCHSDENIYLFPYYFPELNEKDREMVRLMSNLWTSFMENGVPRSEQQPEWLPLTKVTGPYYHINKECTIGTNFIDEYTVVSREANEPKFKDQSKN